MRISDLVSQQGTNGGATTPSLESSRTQPQSEAAELDLWAMLRLVRTHLKWGVLVAVLGVAATLAYVQEFWQQDASATASLQQLERRGESDEPERSLAAEAQAIRSEETNKAAQVLLRYLLEHGTALLDNVADQTVAAQPMRANLPAAQSMWLLIDFETAQPVESATEEAYYDALALAPREARLLAELIHDPRLSAEARRAIERLAEGNIARMVQVEFEQESRGLSLSATHSEPAIAALAVNLVPVAYEALHTRNRRMRNRNAVALSEQQWQRAIDELAQSERTLDEAIRTAYEYLREERGVQYYPVVGASREEVSLMLGELKRELEDLTFQRRAVRESIRRLDTRRRELSTQVYSDPIDARLSELNARERELSVELRPGSDEMRRLRTEIAELKRQRDERIADRRRQNERIRTLEERRAALAEDDEQAHAELDAEIAEARAGFEALIADQLPSEQYVESLLQLDTVIAEAQTEESVLTQRIEQARTILAEVTRQLDEFSEFNSPVIERRTRVQQALEQMQVSAEVLYSTQATALHVPQLFEWHERASTDSARHSSPLAIYLVGIVLSLMGAAGAIALAAVSDTRITADAQLKGLGLTRAIARVPRLPKRLRELRTDRRGNLLYVPPMPAFELLAFNLRHQLARMERDKLVMQITSSIEAEGKSSIAVQLALEFAKQGERTCLLVADRFRPCEDARILAGVSPEDLRSSYGRICGPATHGKRPPIQSCVLQSLYLPSLYVVLPEAGAETLDATGLFQSSRFARLIEYLRERFDVVLLDSPPVLPVVDALAIGRMVDSTLFVVGAGRVSRSRVQASLEKLRAVQIEPIGIVLNFAAPEDAEYDYGGAYGRRYRQAANKLRATKLPPRPAKPAKAPVRTEAVSAPRRVT